MDEENRYSDEVEEDIEGTLDAAKDIYDLARPFNNGTAGDGPSSGDAQKDGIGSQGSAGDQTDPSKDTSEGRGQSDASNGHPNAGGPPDDLASDITSEASENAVGGLVFEAASEVTDAASAEAVGAAAGTAGGPAGVLVGTGAGWAMDHIGTILAVAAGIVLTFFAVIYICLGSWIPAVYDDATLAWNDRRSTDSVQKTRGNFMGAARTDEELSESFNLFKPFFVSMKKGKATDTAEDKWDGAYLLAAYSVYKNMYAGKTGSGSADELIEAASSQLGEHYTEEEANPYAEYVTGREGASGAWCQYFVSWCAARAGIDESVILKCGTTDEGMDFFKKQGRFVTETASYTPKAGDIVYFTYGHVGIVLSADPDHVYTIEGNHGGEVCTVTRDRPGDIAGYGIPAYPETEGSNTDNDDYYSEFFTCYDEGAGTYMADFEMIFTRFIQYLVTGEEVTYDKIRIDPVQVPVYKAVYVKAIENGQTVTKLYYTYMGTESRDYESSMPEYVNVTVELEDHTIDSETYYQATENRITYSPQKSVSKETEVVRSLLSRSTVLYVLNIPADETYKGDVGMNVTNAEYVDHLRTTMIEQLGITESTGTGLFIWPVDPKKYGSKVYQISSYFGYRPPEATDGIGSTDHEGIDISFAGCYRAEARAAASGTVVSAGYSSGYGNYALIDHGMGYATIYMHFDEVLVLPGQSVGQGDTIGLIGTTGPSTGYHLHFGVFKDGEAVDPLSFFVKTTDADGNVIYGSTASSSWYYEKHDPKEYRSMVVQAMNELGIEVTEDKVERIIRQIETESNGDPLAVQHGYTDSNTYRTISDWTCPWCQNRSKYTDDGHSCGNYDRAHGLMQTITSTFLSYKAEGHDDIYNAYDNMLAALNYIRHVYPEDLSGIGEGHGY